MDLEAAGCRARFLIRDRDGKFPGLSGAILADAGIDVVLSGVRRPRMPACRMSCTDEIFGKDNACTTATPALARGRPVSV
jgi:hypothetical protein